MRRWVERAGMGVVAVCLVAAFGAAQDLPIPERWSTHDVWFLVVNPGVLAGRFGRGERSDCRPHPVPSAAADPAVIGGV